jgi:hypothetical protein
MSPKIHPVKFYSANAARQQNFNLGIVIGFWLLFVGLVFQVPGLWLLASGHWFLARSKEREASSKKDDT